MVRYANLNGDSGVSSYQIGTDYIWVGFIKTTDVYEYTYESAGEANVEMMKILAINGRGLCSFIQRNVRKSYSRIL